MEAQTQESKLTYSEIKELANQQQQQLQQMSQEYKRLLAEYNKAMEMVMGRRLDQLFNVLKYKNEFPDEFVNGVVHTIEAMLTPPENTNDCDSAEVADKEN